MRRRRPNPNAHVPKLRATMLNGQMYLNAQDVFNAIEANGYSCEPLRTQASIWAQQRATETYSPLLQSAEFARLQTRDAAPSAPGVACAHTPKPEDGA